MDNHTQGQHSRHFCASGFPTDVCRFQPQKVACCLAECDALHRNSAARCSPSTLMDAPQRSHRSAQSASRCQRATPVLTTHHKLPHFREATPLPATQELSWSHTSSSNSGTFVKPHLFQQLRNFREATPLPATQELSWSHTSSSNSGTFVKPHLFQQLRNFREATPLPATQELSWSHTSSSNSGTFVKPHLFQQLRNFREATPLPATQELSWSHTSSSNSGTFVKPHLFQQLRNFHEATPLPATQELSWSHTSSSNSGTFMKPHLFQQLRNFHEATPLPATQELSWSHTSYSNSGTFMKPHLFQQLMNFGAIHVLCLRSQGAKLFQEEGADLWLNCFHSQLLLVRVSSSGSCGFDFGLNYLDEVPISAESFFGESHFGRDLVEDQSRSLLLCQKQGPSCGSQRLLARFRTQSPVLWAELTREKSSAVKNGRPGCGFYSSKRHVKVMIYSIIHITV